VIAFGRTVPLRRLSLREERQDALRRFQYDSRPFFPTRGTLRQNPLFSITVAVKGPPAVYFLRLRTFFLRTFTFVWRILVCVSKSGQRPFSRPPDLDYFCQSARRQRGRQTRRRLPVLCPLLITGQAGASFEENFSADLFEDVSPLRSLDTRFAA